MTLGRLLMVRRGCLRFGREPPFETAAFRRRAWRAGDLSEVSRRMNIANLARRREFGDPWGAVAGFVSDRAARTAGDQSNRQATTSEWRRKRRGSRPR